LWYLFTEVGEAVNVSFVSEPYIGRSKGCAFVEMDSRSNRQQVMKSLNKKVYECKPHVCNEEKLRKEGKQRR
jgi:RNA recognition motif-containing protein